MAIRPRRTPASYSDKHWLRGWLAKLEAEATLKPSRESWILARPDAETVRALMLYSVAFPHVVRQVEAAKDAVELHYLEVARTNGTPENRADLARAVEVLAARLRTALDLLPEYATDDSATASWSHDLRADQAAKRVGVGVRRLNDLAKLTDSGVQQVGRGRYRVDERRYPKS